MDLATARSQINQSYKYFGSQLPTDQTKCVFALPLHSNREAKKKKLEKICGLFTAINSFGKLMMEVVFQMGDIFF